MTSFLSEQESDYRPPSSPLATSSALARDIHQEHGVLFPTLPSMTVFENPVEDLLGPTPRPPGNDNDPDIFSSDTFSPAPAGPLSSPQNPVVTVFSSDDASDNWSKATSVLPTPPEVQASSNLPTSVTVCIPHPMHERPFIIPPNISPSQYASTLPPCQLYHFESVTDAEMFVWTEIRKREASLIHVPPHWYSTPPLMPAGPPTPPLIPTSSCASTSTVTPTHPYVFNVPPHTTAPTMPPNMAGPTFPTFPSLTGFPVPNMSTTYPSSPFGQSTMPIYIATESTKLKIPDDWDGTKETWPLFKMRMEMAC